MEKIDALRSRLPDDARDLKLNLQSVLTNSSLEPRQRWGVALAVAHALDAPALREAVLGDAAAEVDDATLSDARVAAALMGINNVYYRFRHFMDHAGAAEDYALPARLRMNRIARPATDKESFELYCLAVSAVAGCELCVTSHEKVVRQAGLSAEQVHDPVRIAAVLAGVATALRFTP